ncbi:MAG TPA: cytochrome c [Rhizomicrobium sp.]|nr:cytochrome c [Rhizomicrobium sp.]
MRSLKIVPVLLLLASAALAQTYGVGRAPTAAELAQDITISPTGAGLPVGHGNAAEGKVLFTQKNCIVCHGPDAAGGVTSAPNLLAKLGPEVDAWDRKGGGDGIPVKAPNAIIVWDFIHRGMPLGNEGTLTPNEVYALTAYLLAINKIIPENQVLDQNNLAKVKMPIGNEWVRVPDWKPRSPRLAGYPY